MLQRDPGWLRHDQARWLRPDAHRWLRPDAERWRRPVHPDEQKYNPAQPRVPAGHPDGGQWIDADGAFGRGTDQAVRPRGIDDPRVLSDADPEPIRAGDQYAQSRNRGPLLSSAGTPMPATAAQALRADLARARADEAIARVRELDRRWSPQPSAYETVEGAIRAYEAEAIQAQARIAELARIGIGPGPFAGNSIPARNSGRHYYSDEVVQNNVNGARSGCHTCGTFDPGTRTGNYILDHQNPTGLNVTGRPQRLYPHCVTCSSRQGGHVRHLRSD